MQNLSPLLYLLCSWPGFSGQSATSQGPPAVDQPPNFSHLMGKYSIATSASPTKVFVDDPILLKVSIQGQGPNKDYLPQRKFLKIFSKEMRQDFDIGELFEKDSYDAATHTWHFYYQLQPKNEKVGSIPPLELMYFHQQDYSPSYSDVIPLEVKIPPKVIVAPAGMYDLVVGDAVLRRHDASHIRWWIIVLGLALPPAVCVIFYHFWRYYRPDSAGLVQRRQSRAARQAIYALRRLRNDPQGLHSGALLTRFLHTRIDLTPAEPTPLETARQLWRAGLSPELTERVASFYKAAACRFAPAPDTALFDQRKEAIGLILAVEEEFR